MNNLQQEYYDLPKLIFCILFILVMIIASFWIIKPFIIDLTWAGIVVIVTWPLLIKLQVLLWKRRFLAVIIMTLLLILFFIIPISLLVNSLLTNSLPLIIWASSRANMHFPEMKWLNAVPLVGGKVYNSWHSLIASSGNEVLIKLRPYVGKTATWFVSQAAYLGRFIIHLTLMLLFSILFYFRGEQIAQGIRYFAMRLANKNGDFTIILAIQSIRAVTFGVVVTALVQAILGGITLAIVGIPYVTLLTVLMFILCIVQLGPLLVLIPAIIWLYWDNNPVWGSMLLVWSCILSIFDAVLRPLLIRKSANLPMILIFFGVIGGLLSLGMIGLFIGPMVLVISYHLLSTWIDEQIKP
ncbi:AI-2E family transporter YdiK [Candidatus Fukatsuia anoeciicola]|uniref:AI-2E family transporter YdiK n=1 Tax=Candidatus Fukatsuia anoeciicola TaxID=2994492 RepID=UPI003463FE59